MSKAPSMPMYWDAYLADTTHLTTEEHGAYMLLLGAMWRRNGWVPDDDRDNARILGLTSGKWRKIKARLSNFLIFKDGEISQKKLLETWENTQEKIDKNRANGAKGGRPKSSKSNNLAKAKGSVSVNPNESIPEPEPEPDKESNTAAASLEPRAREASSSKRMSENPADFDDLSPDTSAPSKPPGEMTDDQLLDAVLAAVGLNNGMIPSYWMPPAATVRVGRWRSDLGLTADQIVDAARESRKRHDEPPRGPKALDHVMANLSSALKAAPMKPTAQRTSFSKQTTAPKPVWQQVSDRLKAGNQS